MSSPLAAADRFPRVCLGHAPTPLDAASSRCGQERLELSRVWPGLTGRFIDELPGHSSTTNQALAALRHFFDTLVTRHAAPLNPFQSVRGRKHDATDGKTPGLSTPQARELLGLIDTSHVVGLRDRALLGTLAW